ncbi:flavoprotein [Victivallis sp. Marseille-Q1083]|uniref:flavoprotein n=1 Tax=Victivallis sp. Marseille-Q1083 TaxID=2717288 RepID=UPI00158AFF1B|nr:flavoprotein [Victivallis sp. Marseille-Q1083]
MKNRCIALGVTGGIAAYKAADLTSRLTQAGYEVNVLMTAGACKLVTPLTFQTLSRRPVITSLWELPQWQPGHVALADRAELLAVVPCTANFIGKFAHGLADDALSTYAVTHAGPVLLAPAMNPKMWSNAAVQANVRLLESRGVALVGPDAGAVACGAAGVGRLAAVEEIVRRIQDFFKGE